MSSSPSARLVLSSTSVTFTGKRRLASTLATTSGPSGFTVCTPWSKKSALSTFTSSSSSSWSVDELVRLDQQHVWHPYAAMPNALPCVPIESAHGCELTVRTDNPLNQTQQPKVLIDGMSSWWACIHGYSHPHLVQAAKDQLDKMSHVMFGGLTHEPAVQLAVELAKITPGQTENGTKLDKVFFCDSGSVAVEVAMKMAIQYWYNHHSQEERQHTKKSSSKSKFLTIRGGYHGDTFEAMSVCDPVNGMHHLFRNVLPIQYFAPRPIVPYDQNDQLDEDYDGTDLQVMEDLLQNHGDEIAAVIIEPIVQGAGGMWFYTPRYLQRVRELCTQYNVLLIADEIATGFGRTGKLFAVEHGTNDGKGGETGIVPDIMCIGKALSGGMLSFAATLTNERVAQVFQKGPAGVLMHGPTFMGNPLACAVSLASLELLLGKQPSTSSSPSWQDRIHSIEQQLRHELEPCRDSPFVHDVRVLGAIGVVEMKQPMDMKTIQPAIVEQGVWLRPFGKLLYTMPPFIIEPEQLRKITSTMVSIAHRKP